MTLNRCHCLSLLLLLASGCTYNPVRFDPVTGFNTGGGVGVLCGGPLDPWMLQCCPNGGSGCLTSCLCPTRAICGTEGYPAPICPAPVCPTPGIPLGSPYTPLPTLPANSMMWPSAAPISPMAAPQTFAPSPVPTFAPDCPTCETGSAAGYPVYSQYPQTVQAPLAGVANYPQLFPAPPVVNEGFMMPAPYQGEIPPSVEQLPPHYEMMDPPGGQYYPSQNYPSQNPPVHAAPPAPPAAPMNQQPMNAQPMNQQPMNPQPMPTPAPQGTEAMQTSYPAMAPLPVMQDTRRQQWVPVRL